MPLPEIMIDGGKSHRIQKRHTLERNVRRDGCYDVRETLKGGKVIYELFTGSTTHNKCNTSALSQSAFLQGAYIKYILSVQFHLECVHREVTITKFTIIDLMSKCIFYKALTNGSLCTR